MTIDAKAAGSALFSALAITLLFSLALTADSPAALTGFSVASGQKPRLDVSLSFDIEDWADGNETRTVPALLRMLDGRGIRGTFFIAGKVAERDPDLVRDIRAAGHEIGLHTYEHMFPIFDHGHAASVASAYGTTAEYVWERSYRTTEDFMRSIEANREAIGQALGEGDTGISIFRSPCLVPEWGGNQQYFMALRQSGIMVDSSFIQDFSSRNSSLIAPYAVGGVIEVPVTRGDDALETDMENIARKMQQAGLPMVLFFHPKRFDGDDVARLEGLLSETESEYETRYLTIGDIAKEAASG